MGSSHIKLSDWIFGSSLSAGLYAYWKMNEINSTDVYDSGVNEIVLTQKGTVPANGSKRGEFSTDNWFVHDVPVYGASTPNEWAQQEFMMEVYFSTDQSDITDYHIAGISANRSVVMNNGVVYLKNWSGSFENTSPDTYNDGNIHQAAIVGFTNTLSYGGDSGNVLLVIDGQVLGIVQKTYNASDFGSGTWDFSVGARGDVEDGSGTLPFPGHIHEMAWWSDLSNFNISTQLDDVIAYLLARYNGGSIQTIEDVI